MAKAAHSAGILLFRHAENGGLQVLLVHPGGPVWARREEGAWSIPKGEHGPEDDPRACALREFEEELGVPLPAGQLIDLGSVRQRGGKLVRAWAACGDFDPHTLHSNTFTMRWPPRTGELVEFPEVDRAEWFDLGEAARRINAAQGALLGRLVEQLSARET